MYKRNSRDNSFLSEQNLKHLDSHHSESGNSLNLTDIEDDNKSVSSRISMRSGKSVLEVNDASSKVLIEKLVKDKAKYKAEVKSLKNN
jgi:hypothetical protein